MTEKRDLYQKIKEDEERKRCLPHIYRKLYPWQDAFINEREHRLQFLISGNQIGKTSCQIIKVIRWATSTELWEHLWPTRPRQFWYFYPDKGSATREFKEKWIPDWLPSGKYKDEGQYRWKVSYDQKHVTSLEFLETGVTIYFMSYGKDASTVQSSTVHAVMCFTAGHRVFTKNGYRKIEEIKVGDLVLTREGQFKPVIRTIQQNKKVITRKLSNGKVITGTPDHRFMTTNRGYVPFGELVPEDNLLILEESEWLKERSAWLMGSRFIDTLLRKIGGIIIFVLDGMAQKAKKLIKCFIFICGRNITIQSYQKDIVSTIRTIIQQTIILKICSYLQKGSITQYIKRKCGKLLNILVIFAKNVGCYLNQGVHKKQPVNIVLSNVEREPLEEKAVYNIAVADQHNYYLEGISVSNCDEEMSPDFFDELVQRTSNANVLGYFHMVFTPTEGHKIWRQTMEHIGKPTEKFKEAWKKRVKVEDCMYYSDGTPSLWTAEACKVKRASCSTQNEELKRCDGRFVLDGGLRYCFDKKRNYLPAHKLPRDWLVYAGIDIGSGGDSGHPAAIAFTAINPACNKARTFKVWRGDPENTDGKRTVSKDILLKYLELQQGLIVQAAYYDWASADFAEIAARMNVNEIVKANKKRDEGEPLFNTLMASNAPDKRPMWAIYDIGEESEKFVDEITMLRDDVAKTKASDDLVDATKYSLSSLTFDFSHLSGPEAPTQPDKYAKLGTREKMRAQQIDGTFHQSDKDTEDALTDDCAEWQEWHEDF